MDNIFDIELVIGYGNVISIILCDFHQFYLTTSNATFLSPHLSLSLIFSFSFYLPVAHLLPLPQFQHSLREFSLNIYEAENSLNRIYQRVSIDQKLIHTHTHTLTHGRPNRF